MPLYDLIAFAGHQVHFCRYREAGTLLRWLGDDLTGQRVLDVAGGDVNVRSRPDEGVLIEVRVPLRHEKDPHPAM